MYALRARRSRGRTALLLLVALFLSARPSWAGCTYPEITVGRDGVAAGGHIVVSGVGWSDGCLEPRSGGCGRDDRTRPPALTGIELVLVPGAAARSSIPLGSVDADGNYEFELDVVVPRSTPPGRYTLEARSGEHASEPPIPIVVTR